MLQKLTSKFIQTFIILAAALFSGFMYLNIYETVALTNLPYVPAIRSTQHPRVITDSVPEVSIADKHGFYGKPSVIRVPKLGFVTNLDDSRREIDGWILGNDSVAHYTFGQSNAGVIGDTMVFSLESAKILDIAALLNEGDRVVMETATGWRYNFKVVSKQVVPDGGSFLPSASSTGKLYILDQIDQGTNNLIVECQFVSVEEM